MRWWTLLSLFLLTLLVGCKRDATARLEVLQLHDRHDDKTGLILDLDCKIHNPYSYELSVDRVVADAYLENVKVRNTTVQAQAKIPPQSTRKMPVHIWMSWPEVATAFGHGNSKGKTIGLRIEGKINFARISEAPLPFRYEGNLDRMRLFLDGLKYIGISKKVALEKCGADGGKPQAKPDGKLPMREMLKHLKFVPPAPSK